MGTVVVLHPPRLSTMRNPGDFYFPRLCVMVSWNSRPRGNLEFSKPPLNHNQLLGRMAQRGLTIPEPDRAQRYVRHIGYYRFSPYLIPFRSRPQIENLRPGTTFDDVLDLYVFDRKLRLLVMDAVERIEVAVRAATTDYMSTTYDDAFWYTQSMHFRDQRKHSQFLAMVEKTCHMQLKRQQESANGQYAHTSALEHYLTTYGDPELPPSWVTFELLTLGQLESALLNMRSSSDVNKIAGTLGINGPLIKSWLRTYVRVRNICAHHGRLWNVGLGVYPALPTSKKIKWLVDPSVIENSSDRRMRLYSVLVSLQSMLYVISPNSSWAQRLFDLLEEHSKVPLEGMGIPRGWYRDKFWEQRLSQ